MCPIKQGTLMDMMYMPDALNAAITLMEADPTKIDTPKCFQYRLDEFRPGDDLSGYQEACAAV